MARYWRGIVLVHWYTLPERLFCFEFLGFDVGDPTSLTTLGRNLSQQLANRGMVEANVNGFDPEKFLAPAEAAAIAMFEVLRIEHHVDAKPHVEIGAEHALVRDAIMFQSKIQKVKLAVEC